MLYQASELFGFTLQATDGEIGQCNDFIFDDEYWALRYMEARAGNWLTGRRVLISPVLLDPPDWDNQRFPVKLSRDQIKDAPGIEHDQPVSRQYEISYFDYYRYSYYWMGAEVWGMGAHPQSLAELPENTEHVQQPDSRLRSMDEVKGYRVFAGSEDIGKVDDFLVEADSWVIRYLVVDTGNWFNHNRVVLPPGWIDNIAWKDRQVTMNVAAEKIRSAPPYDADAPISRDYESRFFKHYERSSYWGDK